MLNFFNALPSFFIFVSVFAPGNDASTSSKAKEGMLIFDTGKKIASNRFVSNYTDNAVIVNHGVIASDSSSELKAGFIITQVGQLRVLEEEGTATNDGDYLVDNSSHDECIPVLFRKIVSRKDVGQDSSSTTADTAITYVTSLATFSDIFPEGSYDQSLFDTPIEPLFPKCISESSSADSGSSSMSSFSIVELEDHRFLQENTTALAPFCQYVPPITQALGFITCGAPIIIPLIILALGTIVTSGTALSVTAAASVLLLPLVPVIAGITSVFASIASVLPVVVAFIPLLLPIWFFVLLVLFLTGECDITLESLIGVLGDARSNNSSDSSENDRQLWQQESELFWEPTFVPSKCDDWTSSSSKSTNGKCKYVDCNVGLHHDPESCFYGCGGDVESPACMTMEDSIFNFTGGVVGSPQKDYDTFDFSEAFCVQDHCYLSNAFDKATCDNHFYQSLISTCPSPLQKNHEEQRLIFTAAQFPLQPSILGESCYMLSMLYYLGAKVFGREHYSNMQAKQVQHNNLELCNKQIQF